MAGNTTFIIGTEDERVDEAIEIIGKHSKKRTQMVPSSASYGVGMYTSFPVEVQVGGATSTGGSTARPAAAASSVDTLDRFGKPSAPPGLVTSTLGTRMRLKFSRK